MWEDGSIGILYRSLGKWAIPGIAKKNLMILMDLKTISKRYCCWCQFHLGCNFTTYSVVSAIFKVAITEKIRKSWNNSSFWCLVLSDRRLKIRNPHLIWWANPSNTAKKHAINGGLVRWENNLFFYDWWPEGNYYRPLNTIIIHVSMVF